MSRTRNHHIHPLVEAIDVCLQVTEACRSRSLGMLVGLAALGQMLGYPSNAMASTLYTVTTAGDPGPAGSLRLRQAVAAANSAPGVDPSDNIVQFDPGLVGSTITLAGGEIPIHHPLTVQGPGSGRITIDAHDASRIFNITGADPVHLVSVDISGLSLTRGHSDSGGGAVLAANSLLHMSDVAISASRAVRGGGMRVDRGVAYVDGSSFRNNSASISGGGVEGYTDEMLSITHSTVSGNSAGNSGGGIFADRTVHVYITGSLITGNVAAYGPGSYYAGGGVAVRYAQDCGAISNSTISGNFAAQGGGGIALINPPSGTSLCKYTQIKNDTIVGNATQDGSGNGIFAQGAPYPNIYDSIVANNFSSGDNSDLAGGFAACENFIRTPGTSTIVPTVAGCPGNIIGVDPMLGPLRDNGGPTLSMLPDPASPVIDAGGTMTHPATDQRDLPRTGVDDIGAIERQFPEDLIFRNGFDSS